MILYYIYDIICVYKYSTANEQPGFLLFSVQTETIFKMRKLKRATAGNRTTDLLLSGQANYTYIYNSLVGFSGVTQFRAP